MDFTSLEDLKIRIYPALRNRVSYFKKLGVNDITEEDIFSYFFKKKKRFIFKWNSKWYIKL